MGAGTSYWDKQFYYKVIGALAAADSGNQSELGNLLAEGLDVNEKLWNGQTPLSHVVIAEYYSPETIKLLLDLGAKPEIERSVEDSPVPLNLNSEENRLRERWAREGKVYFVQSQTMDLKTFFTHSIEKAAAQIKRYEKVLSMLERMDPVQPFVRNNFCLEDMLAESSLG